MLARLVAWWKRWLARVRRPSPRIVIQRERVRSTKADAKRRALKFVERVEGRRMGWKAARKRLDRWSHTKEQNLTPLMERVERS
jgi:hypothetical protein